MKKKKKNVRKLNLKLGAVESSSNDKNTLAERKSLKYQRTIVLSKHINKSVYGGKCSKCLLKWPMYFQWRESLKCIDFFLKGS